MRINRFRSVKFALAAAFVAASVLALGAHAQMGSRSRFAGQFTLPFEAHWGSVDLPAGHYTFTVENEFGGTKQVVHLMNGTRTLGMVMPEQFSTYNPEQINETALLCVRNAGTYSVRAVTMPEVGVLYYTVPKNKAVQVTKAPELIERVPVQMASR